MVVKTLQEFFFNTDYERNILMQSNYLVYCIVFVYVVFVKFQGPSLMNQRNALDLYYFVILFNIMLVISNATLCYAFSELVWKYWSNRCHLKYNSDFSSAQKVFGYLSWQLLLLKIVELFDTVIFILRKKFNQISFLHVFHHSIVVVVFWTVLKSKEIAYYVLLTCAINCGVHVVMYLYYCLSAIGPSVRKFLWWKKYLTAIQILQFFVVLVYMVYSFLTGCEEFATLEKMWFCTTLAVCVLFLNFYFTAYSQKK